MPSITWKKSKEKNILSRKRCSHELNNKAKWKKSNVWKVLELFNFREELFPQDPKMHFEDSFSQISRVDIFIIHFVLYASCFSTLCVSRQLT